MTSFGVASISPFNKLALALADLCSGEKKIVIESKHKGSTNDFDTTTTIRVVGSIQDD